MKGESKIISNFMAGEGGGKFHFQIPVYQRPYSWTEFQCERLYADIINTFQEHRDSHFIGSIVYQGSSKSGPRVYTIIDGQQRLTTLYLLFLAMRQVALDLEQQLRTGTYNQELIEQGIIEVVEDAESEVSETKAMGLNQDQLQEYAEEIFNRFLSNKFRAKGRSEQIRFHLIESDQPALEKLFAGDPKEFENNSLLTKNFNFFYNKVLHEIRLHFDELMDLASNLSFISIELESDDDAQLIFESLNSTGLKLSEGDKIRNYMLMQFNETLQSLYYHDYWKKIDANCRGNLDLFVRHYLSIKLGRSPSENDLYPSFKSFLASGNNNLELERVRACLVELVEYSKLFCSMSTCLYEVPEPLEPNLSDFKRVQLQTSIEKCLKRLKFLPSASFNPFILQCLMMHQRKQLSGEELLEVCHIVETFVLRRWVCNLKTNGLNRFFQNLHASINASKEEGNLAQKLGKMLLQNTSDTNRLPNDSEFENALRQNNFYLNSRSKSAIYYLLERLENGNNLETLQIFDMVEHKQLSIEHIMPQKLSPEWKSALGANAQSVHKTWLDRLGNLTLTAYNSKYSNSSFEEKCNMEKGFNESGLRLVFCQ